MSQWTISRNMEDHFQDRRVDNSMSWALWLSVSWLYWSVNVTRQKSWKEYRLDRTPKGLHRPFSRHLWGLRCIKTAKIWHHARIGGRWDLHLNKFLPGCSRWGLTVYCNSLSITLFGSAPDVLQEQIIKGPLWVQSPSGWAQSIHRNRNRQRKYILEKIHTRI